MILTVVLLTLHVLGNVPLGTATTAATSSSTATPARVLGLHLARLG